MGTFIIILAFISITILFYLKDDDGLGIIFPLIVCFFIIVLGILILGQSVESKKPITPDLVIECTNGTCDTTYVYTLKN